VSVNNDECDLGPPIDLDDLRRRVPLLPSISEISAQLEDCLGITRATVLPTDSDILSPKSVCSQGLSQVDSGFGSPPFFVADDDDEEDIVEEDDGNISGIEPFEMHDDFRDILGDNDRDAGSLTVDGKSRSGLCAEFCRR